MYYIFYTLFTPAVWEKKCSSSNISDFQSWNRRQILSLPEKTYKGCCWKQSSPHALWVLQNVPEASPLQEAPEADRTKPRKGHSPQFQAVIPSPSRSTEFIPSKPQAGISPRVPGHSHSWDTAQPWSIPALPSWLKPNTGRKGIKDI